MLDMPVGRPTDYTPALAASICEQLAEGKSLNAICAVDGMPHKSSVYLWLTRHSEFSDMYARAREDQADTLADEIIDIADTPLMGVKTKTDGEGNVETTEGDMLEHRRLQVDARKWVAAKLKPRKYGERIDMNHTGMNVLVNISLDAEPVTIEHDEPLEIPAS